MRKILALVLATTLAPMFPPAALAQPADGGTAVRAVGAEYLATLTEDSLYLRMKQGRPLDRLPDLSLARAEARAQKGSAGLGRLEAIPEAGLPEEDRLSREMLRRKLRFEVEAPRHYWLGFEVTPYASPLGEVHMAFRALPLRTPADTDAFLALLGQYPAFVGHMRTRLEAQAKRGIRVPKDEVPLVKAYLEGAIVPGPASPFAVPDARLQGLDAARAASFRAALAGRTTDAQAALKALLDSVLSLAGEAPETVGLSQYPGGRAAYEMLVKLHTTLDVTPEQVHAIGLEEVARIEAGMAEVRKRLDFTGTPAEFRESVRKDPRFRARSAEEVGERLMAHDARIQPKVDAYFLRWPKAAGGVKRLDAEREPALTFGIYEMPSPTEPRGLYRFNGSKLEERSLLTAAALIYHELVPGHHFQINLASENETIPPFRRELTDSAYTEGWGEYSSGLAGEMGMYADPYDLYGRFSMEMFLAVRLVVDTGMNALGWPRSRAVAYMRDHLMESATQIETESLRYSVDIPGQALAYKMGSRGIWDLRRKAEKTLGPRFDIRRFHECVLGSGSLPLETLGRKVDFFIEHAKSEAPARP